MAWRAPSSGELRDRITVQKLERTRNEIGGFHDSWTDLVSVRARVEHERGGETVRSKRLTGVSIVELVVRNSAALRTIASTTHRVIVDGETLDIKWAGSFDRGRTWLVLHCERGGTQHV